MDRIINYLLLTIIFVFDPLAIALVIAANFAFEQLKNKTIENVYGETVPRKKVFEVLDAEPKVKTIEKIVKVPVEVEKIVEKIVEKNIYDKDVEKKLELLNHPRIKKAIKHAKRAGEL